MVIAVHQPQYLPWSGYFHKIACCDRFVFLDCVQYKEREFQNRNRILTARGPLWLTVPVKTGGAGRQPLREIRIDNTLPWRRKHRESIRTSYACAPFFDAYYPFFDSVFARSWEHLLDLNVQVITYMLNAFGISTPLSFESEIGTSAMSTGRILEICRKLAADTYLSGAGGKAYLNEASFEQERIRLIYQQFTHQMYEQCWQHDNQFVSHLSAIDLLFNCGSGSRDVLVNDRVCVGDHAQGGAA